MKSLLPKVQALYAAIFTDTTAVWPDLVRPLEKDYSYLRRALSDRGLAFACHTLPSLGKWFDRSLSLGHVQPFDESLRGIKWKANRPIFIGELMNMVFDHEGLVRTQACETAILYIRTILFVCKRIELNYTQPQLKEALNDFFSIEEALPSHHGETWECEFPRWTERRGHPLWGPNQSDPHQLDILPTGDPGLDDRAWDTFYSICRAVISGLGTPSHWEVRPRHGPGAVSERRAEFISKYEFPNWPRRLDHMFPFEWFGSGVLDSGYIPDDRELPSRLVAVPKTFTGPRLICSEPLANQWLQQAIRGELEGGITKSLLKGVVTLRSQENSRRRALRGSRDQSLATIDLSSASDRISTRLVEYVFQGSPWLDYFQATRTRYMVQNLSNSHPKGVRLKKFSTQGSALTFPVQSIIFSCISITAVYIDRYGREAITLDRLRRCARQVTVYGDDIIIPTYCVNTAIRLLEECGLRVNRDKSHYLGSFRESCGCDAYNGVDVTPPYFTQAYDGSAISTEATVELSNNFHRSGFWMTARYVASQIPPKELKLLRVISEQDGGLGLFSYVGSSTSHLKGGYCEDFHREYSICLGIEQSSETKQGRGLSSLSQYFFEDPDPYYPYKSGGLGVTLLRKCKVRDYA